MNTVSNIDNLLVSLGQTVTPAQTNKSTDAKIAGASFLDVLQNFAATLASQAPAVAPTAQVTDMPAWLSALLTAVGPNALITQTPDPITGEALAGTTEEISASLTNIMAAVQTVVAQNGELTSPTAQTIIDTAAQTSADPADNTSTDQNIINLVNTVTALSGAFQAPAPVIQATTPEAAANIIDSSAPVSAVSANGGQPSVASMNVPNGHTPATVVVSPATGSAVNGDKTVAASPDTAQNAAQMPQNQDAGAYVAAQTTAHTAKPSTPTMPTPAETLNPTGNSQATLAKASNTFTRTTVAQAVAGNVPPTANASVTASAMDMPAANKEASAPAATMAFSVTEPATQAKVATAPANNTAAPVMAGSIQATATGNKTTVAPSTAANAFARTLENQTAANITVAQAGATVPSAGGEKTVAFTLNNETMAPNAAGRTPEAGTEFSVSPAQNNGALTSAVASTPQTVDVPQTGTTPELPVLKQISESARIFRQQGSTSVRMHLQPEELGQVLVQLKVVNGEVSVQVLAESAKAQALIQDNLAQLKTAFNNQGLNTQYLEVALGSDASAFNQPHQQSGPWGRQNGSAKQSDSAPFPAVNAVDTLSRNRAESLSGRVDYQI